MSENIVEDAFLLSPLLSSQPGLEHGFGTRDSTPPPNLVTLTQVHSADVVFVEHHRPGSHPPGDALITQVPGIAIGVSTADCVPILLYDTRNRAIGAVHAGWRGIVKGIIGNTLAAMKERFDSSPRDILAGIGSAVEPCCYEVGEDVISAFRETFPWWESVVFPYERGRARLDLYLSVALVLDRLGIDPSSIDPFVLCTSCNPCFHSYRRDGKGCGRQISYIRLMA